MSNTHAQTRSRQQTHTHARTVSHIDTPQPIKQPCLIKGIISAIISLYVRGVAILHCGLKYNH